MNALPTMRELPPRRRAEIRAELERTVAHATARSRLVPLAAAAAAIAVLGAATVLATRDAGDAGRDGAGDGGGGTEVAAGTQPTPTTGGSPFHGLTAEQVRDIERGCVWSTGLDRPNGTQPPSTTGPSANGVRLRNLVDDEAGRFALLYGDEVILDCTIDGPAMPYNSGLSGLADATMLPGPIAVDLFGARSGGDVADNKEIYRGQRGLDQAVGRIRADVVRVTMTVDGQTVDAVLANGTFVARIVRPSTWSVPATARPMTIRAYDAAGALLAEIDPTASTAVR